MDDRDLHLHRVDRSQGVCPPQKAVGAATSCCIRIICHAQAEAMLLGCN